MWRVLGVVWRSRDRRPLLRTIVTLAAGMFTGGAVVAWMLRDEEPDHD